ncbi:MAG TPA: flagellar export protein FliJ [Rhodoferax sp.]|jgi:flagellar FliJ protein|nr:flagellar export protein FliJ [Rhodoferax sp.]HPW27980.1 flagellar export protein FliJ [Rhodoferax sp.]
MSHLRSVALAIEHATIRRDHLAQVAANVERNLQFARQQLAQLEGYAADTDARWIGSAAREISAQIIRHQYQFMDRLQQAIVMQTGVISGVVNQLDQARTNLLQAEFRLAGLNQILKTRKEALNRVQQQREQRQMDEFAAMQHARNRALPMSGETHDY